MEPKLETVRAKKSLGQHFLKDKNVPPIMADAASLTEGEVVLEVGPGTGVLTNTLLDRGATVIAIETDERSVEALKKTFESAIKSGTLQIHHTDILSLDLHALGLKEYQYKVVANIPYYISGQLFRYFLDSDLQPSDLVFLVQKEVADRIARSKKESLLSLSVKAFGTPQYIHTVGKRYFTPPPKVDSAVIAVTNISHNHFTDLDKALFFTILHHGFAAKRKQLLGNLSKHYDRALLIDIFSTLGITETIRGEDLPLEIWLKLARALAAHN